MKIKRKPTVARIFVPLLLLSIILCSASCFRPSVEVVDRPLRSAPMAGNPYAMHFTHFLTKTSILQIGEELPITISSDPYGVFADLEEGYELRLGRFASKMEARYESADSSGGIHQGVESMELLSLDAVSEEHYEEYSDTYGTDRAIVQSVSVPASWFSGDRGSICVLSSFSYTLTPAQSTEEPTESTYSCECVIYYIRESNRVVLFDNAVDYAAYPYVPEPQIQNEEKE